MGGKKIIIDLVVIMNKILKVIFVILFVILIGELAYLAYSNWYGNNAKSNSTAVPSSAPTTNVITTSSAVTEAGESFSNEENLANITAFIKEGLVDKAYFINEIKGNIIKLQDKGIEPPFKTKPAYQPELFIQLEINRNGKQFKPGLYFDKEELSTLTITKQNTKVSPQNLEIGQTIVIKENWDLIKQAVTSYEITIL